MDWFMKVVTKSYATFSGRARRKEYWMFQLVNFFVAMILTVAGMLLKAPAITLLYNLFILLPSWSVSIRRMHDTDHVGWWILCPFYNLYLLCLDGTPGSNRFGPSPKETGTSLPIASDF